MNSENKGGTKLTQIDLTSVTPFLKGEAKNKLLIMNEPPTNKKTWRASDPGNENWKLRGVDWVQLLCEDNKFNISKTD